MKLDLWIINPRDESDAAVSASVSAHSGSALTWIPERIMRAADIPVRKSGVQFMKASGRIILRDVGFAILKCGEFECADEVIFAQPGDPCRIGSRTLDGFNARVDFAERRLVAAGPIPAA